MLNTYRKNDAVLVVCQNNQAQVIEIAGVNERAQQITGYSAEELAHKPLVDILDNHIAETIEDYVDYNDAASDLGDVLAKVHSVTIIDRDHLRREYRLRVVRSESVENNPVFHIVLQDEEEQRATEAFKKVLHENFKGHETIDERLGLPNRPSLIKDLELVQHYQQKRVFGACFAVMRIDRIDEIRASMGPEASIEILRHISQLCRQRLRKDDQVGMASESALGLILMDITPECSRIVLNRLRWSISSMPMIMNSAKKLELSVSVSFNMIHNLIPEDILYECEEKLKSLGDAGGNAILEVV